MSNFALNSLEKKSTLILGSIFSIRLLSIFLVLPIFALYAEKQTGATPFLVGLALGATGLMQAILQLPFGVLSDKYGRRPIVILGLLFLGVGSLILSFSNHIVWLIIGRLLQGSSAIGSVILAWLSDLVREELRPRALGLMGISIGLAFALSMVGGPFLNQFLNIKTLFAIMAVLSVIAIGLSLKIQSPTYKQSYLRVVDMVGLLKNKRLLRINAGAFILHALLTALFLILPSSIVALDVFKAKLSIFYLMVLGLSLLLTVPGFLSLEKSRVSNNLYFISITGLLMSQLFFLCFEPSTYLLVGIMTLFFGAFNLIEMLLPAMVAQEAPLSTRGAAMGANTTFQFLGIFLGGIMGGWLNGVGGSIAVRGFCVILIVFWLGLELAFLLKKSLN